LKKKILILGASGFIGQNLYLYFKKKNYKVFGTYLNKPVKNSGKKNIFKCNLANYNEIKSISDKIKNIDVIINAAAITSGAKDIINSPHIHVNDNAIINSNITKLS
jgi:nucleoside-diphosphate-sugar epimerase